MESNEELMEKLRRILDGSDGSFIKEELMDLTGQFIFEEEDDEYSENNFRFVHMYLRDESNREIERIIDVLSNQEDAGNHFIEVIRLAIRELSDRERELRPRFKDVIDPTLQRLISLPEERVNDNVVAALRNPLQFFRCSSSIGLDNMIENELKIYENSIGSARVRAVLAEVREKEKVKEKKEFRNLLEKITKERRRRESYLDYDYLDYFSGISLNLNAPLLNYQTRDDHARYYSESKIDDEICQLLIDIILGDEIEGDRFYSIKNRCAELLRDSAWPLENKEFCASWIKFFKDVLKKQEELMNYVKIPLIEGMKKVINFDEEENKEELSLRDLLYNYLFDCYFDEKDDNQLRRWGIANCKLRLQAVDTLSEINNFQNDDFDRLVSLFVDILKHSVIIRNQYFCDSDPDRNTNARPENASSNAIKDHEENEEKVVILLLKTLKKYAETNPEIFQPVLADICLNVNFFANFSDSLKLDVIKLLLPDTPFRVLFTENAQNAPTHLPQPTQVFPVFNLTPSIQLHSLLPAAQSQPVLGVGPGVFFGFGQQQAMPQPQPAPVIPVVHIPGLGGPGTN
jgi:hypothetical protein